MGDPLTKSFGVTSAEVGKNLPKHIRHYICLCKMINLSRVRGEFLQIDALQFPSFGVFKPMLDAKNRVMEISTNWGPVNNSGFIENEQLSSEF